VQLTNLTGGAVLSPLSVADVQIQISDSTPPVRGSSGSGGFEYLSLLLLGILQFLRPLLTALGRLRTRHGAGRIPL
jgi:hypothetical protein